MERRRLGQVLAELEHRVGDPPLRYSATDNTTTLECDYKQSTALFKPVSVKSQKNQLADHVSHTKSLPRRLTRCGVWIGDKVSTSDLGNSMPFLFISSYTWTTPVKSGLLLKASAQA